MTFLIVGLDLRSRRPWHANVKAGDAESARRLALARARSIGVELVVAGIIGPNSTLVA